MNSAHPPDHVSNPSRLRMAAGVLAQALFAFASLACSAAPAAKAAAPDAPGDPAAGERACTEIGCTDGLHVTFDADTAWPEGSYRFVIEADDSVATCEGKLPLLSCADGPSVRCDAQGVMIGESGCALPAGQHGFSGIDLPDAPTKVTLRVERDGVVLADETIAPSYTRTQPNGPGCPPVCHQAGHTMGW